MSFKVDSVEVRAYEFRIQNPLIGYNIHLIWNKVIGKWMIATETECTMDVWTLVEVARAIFDSDSFPEKIDGLYINNSNNEYVIMDRSDKNLLETIAKLVHIKIPKK